MRRICVVFLSAWLAAGCAERSVQLHAFPSAWPQGLPQPEVAQASASAAGPTVWVEPLALDLGEPAAASQTQTAQVLTELLVQKLRQVGVNVSSEGSQYALVGVVPRLGYSKRGGYPRRITYLSQLSYQLVHRPSGAVVWEGNLSQEFEQTVLVNTMTRLPEDPQAPVHVLMDRCVGPTWEAIAQDVSAFLKDPPASSSND